ncbi:MAG: hypothetical protein ACRDL5_16635, partial [Solirubrobacteraceae bacterium]
EVIGLGGGSGPSTGTSSSTTSPNLAATGHHAHKRSRRSTRGSATTGAHSTNATTVKLQLVPTGAVYVCLVNGAGKLLIPGVIYDTGQTIPIKRGPKLLLTLGNASVTMKVDGLPVTVPATGRPVGFQLTPGSTTQLPPAKQPQCT